MADERFFVDCCLCRKTFLLTRDQEMSYRYACNQYLCPKCREKLVPTRVPTIGMTALNPMLKKFEDAVIAGKVDIGLKVYVSLHGVEHFQPVKPPRMRSWP